MFQKKLMVIVGLLVAASMIMAACQQAPVVSTPEVQVQTVVVTQVVPGAPQTTVQVQVITATPVPATPTTGPTAAPAAKAADTVVLASQQEPDTMHPLIGSMLAKTIALGPVAVGCMGQDETTKWIPLGCETVPTIENGGAVLVGDGADKHLEVTYKIRKDWRWTDGTPVTSADAVYYWKLYMDPDFEVADRTAIEKVYSEAAVDAQTVKIIFMSNKQILQAVAGTLKGDVAFATYKDDYVSTFGPTWKDYAVDPVYWSFIGWLPSAVLSKIPAKDQAKSDYAKKPMGDGPYVVTDWKAGQEIDYALSDKPFPLGTPKIKKIVLRFYSDSAGVLASLQKGEIDALTGTSGLDSSFAPDLDKVAAAGAFKVWYLPQYAWEHIDLNTTKFPLDDVKVRQALYYAMDRKAIVDKLYYGKYLVTNLPVPPGLSWAYTENITKYDYSPDKAKALLKDAGWDCSALPCTKKDKSGNTVKLEITLMTTDRASRQSVAQVIQSQWKAVGIGTNLQFLYGRGLFATQSAGGPLSSRTFDAAIYTWISGDDPSLYTTYSCTSIPSKGNGWAGQNYPGWCNKDANDSLNQAENVPEIVLSRDKRKPLYEKFFQLWTTEVPVIPLYAASQPYAARVGFKNFKPGPTQYDVETWNTWEWDLSK